MVMVWMMMSKDTEYKEEFKVMNFGESIQAEFRSVEKRTKRKLVIKEYEEVTIIRKVKKVEIGITRMKLTSEGNDIMETEEKKLWKKVWENYAIYPKWKLNDSLPLECEHMYRLSYNYN